MRRLVVARVLATDGACLSGAFLADAPGGSIVTFCPGSNHSVGGNGSIEPCATGVVSSPPSFTCEPSGAMP